jgi:hypothetical protein
MLQRRRVKDEIVLFIATCDGCGYERRYWGTRDDARWPGRILSMIEGLAINLQYDAQEAGIDPRLLPTLVNMMAESLAQAGLGDSVMIASWVPVAAHRVQDWIKRHIDANAVLRAAEGASQNLAHGDVPERDAHQKGLRIDPEACCDDQEPRGGNGP